MPDSIFTRAQNARSDSSDLATYCNNMAPITCKVGTQLFIVVLVALMMAIGITHLNDCNVNSFIPIYLIASGGLYIGWLVVEICCDHCEYPNIKIWVRILMSLSGIGLFIAGNIWVYGAWDTVETKKNVKNLLNDENYCSPWVYWVAFCDITIISMLTVIAIFSLLVWCLLACCVKLCCKATVDESTPLTGGRSDRSESPA